jgi:hypothetical protein
MFIVKITSGRVKETVKAYLFGHYDSRGGAFMVLAKNPAEALKKVSVGFGGGQLGDEAAEDGLLDAMLDDFIGRRTVVVCDDALPPEDAELDEDYADPGAGFKYGVVQQSYQKPDGSWSKWGDTETMVLWKGRVVPKLDAEAVTTLPLKHRVKRERLGEDACGLCLVR